MAHIKIVEWVELKFPFEMKNPSRKMYIKWLGFATELNEVDLKKISKLLVKKECVEIRCTDFDVAEALARMIERHGAKLEVNWVRQSRL